MFMKLVIAALVLVGLGLAVRIYMGRPAEDVLRADERVDIRALRDPLPGNAFLTCPPDYCQATAAPSPVFPLPIDRLGELWAQMLAMQPNVVKVAATPDRNRLVLIQHTPLLRFPDIVTVEFVPAGPDKSSLAVYSRSRYGKGDFGTNRKRVLDWLAKLQALAGQ
jgi:uncharacterized protein (DUF1499 family)